MADKGLLRRDDPAMPAFACTAPVSALIRLYDREPEKKEGAWHILDLNTGRYRSLVSLKHMAQAAGIGTIGRNTLLITPQYGSLVWLGGVLTEMEISPDPLLPAVCTNCGLCVKSCPVHALDGELLDQETCYSHASAALGSISCKLIPLCTGFYRHTMMMKSLEFKLFPPLRTI